VTRGRVAWRGDKKTADALRAASVTIRCCAPSRAVVATVRAVFVDELFAWLAFEPGLLLVATKP